MILLYMLTTSATLLVVDTVLPVSHLATCSPSFDGDIIALTCLRL